MSLHYHFLRINHEDLHRVRAMRLDNRLPRSVLVGRAPQATTTVAACPIDSEAADVVRREVPAVTLSVAGIYQIRL